MKYWSGNLFATAKDLEHKSQCNVVVHQNCCCHFRSERRNKPEISNEWLDNEQDINPHSDLFTTSKTELCYAPMHNFKITFHLTRLICLEKHNVTRPHYNRTRRNNEKRHKGCIPKRDATPKRYTQLYNNNIGTLILCNAINY